ncbi:SET and MYND domain-containing protein 4-like [Culex quinquefasciatus]|uniref:SET and MYND domain-containing protein 4-like n=1 Tax=Culex quinquefasciatus TaxID=7176 RepID=UPI0018E38A99|nr:SET and MYND domain-containing protein 4-like [Culex quinquefasciatus]
MDKLYYCLTRPRVFCRCSADGTVATRNSCSKPRSGRILGREVYGCQSVCNRAGLRLREGNLAQPRIRICFRHPPTGAIDLLQEMLLERVVIRADLTLYQDFIPQRRDLLLVPEQGKCDTDAARFRNTGNRLYLDGKYGEALVWCFAEKETNRLATGYGNRSAVYFEQGEYVFALYNIDLAKKHDYPEKLMPKLRVMELNCKQQIAAGRSKGTVPSPRMDINVDTNPKIPFLAKGIRVDHRRILVAEKDLNPGDVRNRC